MTTSISESVRELQARRLTLIQDLLERPSGLSFCKEHTRIADAIVSACATALAPVLSKVAVIAVGGYGREELSPFSDIDISVVPDESSEAEIDAPLRHFFQNLHWAFSQLGIQVGYAYRLVSDAAGLDAKTRTGLLDARLVGGTPRVFGRLQEALDESFAAGEFILEKIAERRAMFARYNDTPLAVEPHLKEGAGGIRCFHSANWLRTAIGERESRPKKCYDELLQMRNLLHGMSGKHNDLLTRGRQVEIADLLGTDPFSLMSRHVDHAQEVHGYYCRAVEKLNEARFLLSKGCIAVRGEARIHPGADAGEAAVGMAVATKLGLRTPDIPTTDFSSVSGAAATYALLQGEQTIRNIDRAGILERLLPELTRCRTLIPRDSIHAYTVYEHTLRVLGELENLDEWLADIHNGLHDPGPLILAALLHDVGKFDSEPDHEKLGAEAARAVAQRWQLGSRIQELTAWLVDRHLLISHILRFRDLADPATAQELANEVRDEERLGMLVLLSYADVKAVAPGVWTVAQEEALRELYSRTKSLLDDEVPAFEPARQRQRLIRELRDVKVSESAVQEFVQALPVHYLNAMPFEQVRLHMDFVERAKRGEITIEATPRPDVGGTDFTVCCPDSAGLLSRILGTFYALDLRVQGIRACTTAGVPIALDIFTVNFVGKPVPGATASEAIARLRQVLSGEKSLDDLIRDKGKDPDRDQRVLSCRYVEGNPGILEIRAPRGRGLPFRLARWVAKQGWNVHSARLGQWADNASAALYISKQDGSPLSAADVERALPEKV